jgi:hypothetical protein
MTKGLRHLYTQVPTDTYEAVMQQAAEMGGLSAQDTVARLVEYGLESLAKDPITSSAQLRIFAKDRQIRREAQVIVALENIAKMLQVNPSDERWEEFVSMCKDVGVIPQEVIDGLQSTSRVVLTDPESDNAKTWLIQYVGSRAEIPVAEIERAGEVEGYSSHQLIYARKCLKWGSVKRGKSWYVVVHTNRGAELVK